MTHLDVGSGKDVSVDLALCPWFCTLCSKACVWDQHEDFPRGIRGARCGHASAPTGSVIPVEWARADEAVELMGVINPVYAELARMVGSPSGPTPRPTHSCGGNGAQFRALVATSHKAIELRCHSCGGDSRVPFPSRDAAAIMDAASLLFTKFYGTTDDLLPAESKTMPDGIKRIGVTPASKVREVAAYVGVDRLPHPMGSDVPPQGGVGNESWLTVAQVCELASVAARGSEDLRFRIEALKAEMARRPASQRTDAGSDGQADRNVAFVGVDHLPHPTGSDAPPRGGPGNQIFLTADDLCAQFARMAKHAEGLKSEVGRLKLEAMRHASEIREVSLERNGLRDQLAEIARGTCVCSECDMRRNSYGDGR